jgi:hypothetical protein
MMLSLVRIQIRGRVSSLMNTYHRLSTGYGEMAFVERHNPYSDFRDLVRKLDRDTKGLFKDTLVKLLIYASSFDVNLIMSTVH